MNSSKTDRKQGALRVPAAVVESIENVLLQYFGDELRDYQSRTVEDRESHVFKDLLRVRRFLNKKQRANNQGS